MSLNKRIFIPLMCTLFSLVSILNVFAQANKPESETNFIRCYRPLPIEHKILRLEECKKSLELLEDQYKQNKISKDTYEQRKKSLQDQIKYFEKEKDVDED